jgi:hypothetical protein
MRAAMRVPLFVLLLAGCGDADVTPPDLQPLGAFDSCEGKPTSGATCDAPGAAFSCSTREWDLCCVCIALVEGNRWKCFGPHVFACGADTVCGVGATPGRACSTVGATGTCGQAAGVWPGPFCVCSTANTWSCSEKPLSLDGDGGS